MPGIPRWFNATVVIVVALAVGPPAALGATITPTTTDDDFGTDTGQCSLREAVQLANTDDPDDSFGGCTQTGDDDADIIQLTSGLTYNLTIPDIADEDANANGDIDILNEELTIETTGPGRATIDGNGDGLGDPVAATGDRVFHMPAAVPGPAVTLTNLVITDGFAPPMVNGGGGFYLENSGGPLTITNTRFTKNKTDGFGTLAIMKLGVTVTITGSTFDDNFSDAAGGAIWSTGSILTLTRTTVSGNTATFAGGGIFFNGLFGTYTLINSTISGNSTGGPGGGIRAASVGNIVLTNTTVAGNTADADGDGLTTPDGGGVSADIPFTARSSIIADNIDASTAGNVHPDCSGTVTSQGYNLIESIAGCSGTVLTDITGFDPMLAPLADNGGKTLTRGLNVGSPAINAGNPAIPHDGAGMRCEAADQREVLRLDTDPCDIGSFEGSLALPPVSPGPSGGSGPTATGLRAAALKKCKKKKKKSKKARKKCKKKAKKLPV